MRDAVKLVNGEQPDDSKEAKTRAVRAAEAAFAKVTSLSVDDPKRVEATAKFIVACGLRARGEVT